MSWKYLNKKTIGKERAYQVILSPLVTEKSTYGGENNQVMFKVAVDSTKSEIKAAVETLFKVEVISVNTLNVKGKTKTFKGRKGVRSDWKKAVVRLADDSSIDVMTGVA